MTADFVCDAMSLQRDLLPFPTSDTAYSHLRGAYGSRNLKRASDSASRDSPDKPAHSHERCLESESRDAPRIAAPKISSYMRRASGCASKDALDKTDPFKAAAASVAAAAITERVLDSASSEAPRMVAPVIF